MNVYLKVSLGKDPGKLTMALQSPPVRELVIVFVQQILGLKLTQIWKLGKGM